MAALIETYLKIDTLETILSVLKKRGEKGVKLTTAINNDQDNYGNNVAQWVSQSKEAREAGKKKFYTGNGKVLWTDGQIAKAQKKEEATQPAVADNDVPF